MGSAGDYFYCLNSSGGEEWSYSSSTDFDSSPAIADLNGDNITEILMGSDDDSLYCFNVSGVISSGEQRWWRYGGSPSNAGTPDSDGDYLDDVTESFYECSPTNFDSDNDGLSDGEEVYFLNTNPFDDDSDNDGISDGAEIDAGTDPLVNDSSDDDTSDDDTTDDDTTDDDTTDDDTTDDDTTDDDTTDDDDDTPLLFGIPRNTVLIIGGVVLASILVIALIFSSKGRKSKEN